MVSGDSVTADVGRNLNLESRQDTASFDSRQFSASINATVGYGASVSASVNMAKSKTDYASVNEQTGIQAGSGGFQINVKGNTDLKGATIASNQEAIDNNKNSLTTTSLTQSNIQNSSNATAQGVNLGYSYDSQAQAVNSGKYGAPKQIAENLAGIAVASTDSSSTTRSGVSGANLTINCKASNTANGDIAKDSAGKVISTLTPDQTTSGKIFKQDLADLKAQVALQQTFQQQLVKVTEKFTDNTFHTMFVAAADMYVVSKDANGKPIIRQLSDAEKQNLEKGSDGKVHVSNNGIFNNLEEAANNALQNAKGYEGPRYLIHFQEANSTLSELLVAGYQKFMEGTTMGVANATQQNVNLMNQYGAAGLVMDGHGRGGLTLGNTIEIVGQQPQLPDVKAPLANTNANLFGSAYNAQTMSNNLNTLSNGNGTVSQQTHKDDFVGAILDGNSATGGTTPQGSNKPLEWLNIFNGDSTAHNNYGSGKDSDSLKN